MNRSGIRGNVKLYKRPNRSQSIINNHYLEGEIQHSIEQIKKLQSHIVTATELLTHLEKKIDNIQLQYAEQEKRFLETKKGTDILVQLHIYLLEQSFFHQPAPLYVNRPNDLGLGKEMIQMEGKKNGREKQDNKRDDLKELKQKIEQMEQLIKEQQKGESQPITKPAKRRFPAVTDQQTKPIQPKPQPVNKSQLSNRNQSNHQQRSIGRGVTFRDIQKAESIYSVPSENRTRTTRNNIRSDESQQIVEKIEVKQKPTINKEEKKTPLQEQKEETTSRFKLFWKRFK